MKRWLIHGGIVAYCLLLLSAFSFTMLRLWLPGTPWQVGYFAYMSMAPYQGNPPWNEAMSARGKLLDGSWQAIDLQQVKRII